MTPAQEEFLRGCTETDTVNGGSRLKVDVVGAVASVVKIEDTAGNALTSTGSALDVNLKTSPLLPASLGQKAMVASLPIVIASDQSAIPVTPAATENFLGAVGGKSIVIKPTITTTAGAYTANDVVGGILTLAAGRISGKEVTLENIEVLDFTNQKQPFTILFFESNPTNGTFTDNAALVWGTDYQKCIGKLDVAAADYESIVSVGLANLTGLNKVMTPSGSVNIYAVIMTTGTPTYAANATSLYVRFGFYQD